MTAKIKAPYKGTDGKWYFGDNVGPFDTRGQARARRDIDATAKPAPKAKKKAKAQPKKKVTAKAKKKAVTKKTSKKKAKATPRGRKGSGIVEAIRTGFQAGNTTVAEIEIYLKKVKVTASPNTIKTQVGRLRKSAGLTKIRKEKGIVATIRKGFAKGNDTVAKMARFLDKAGVEASPNTIKTQVGRLRRAEGLTGKAA
jgi:hypothetical protein